jgi:type III pantothenate kinase
MSSQTAVLIDAGNSRMKWAWSREGELLRQGRFAYAADLAAQLDDHWRSLPAPDIIGAGAVAPAPVRETIEAWCLEHWRMRPRYLVATGAACGVHNAYAEPSRLGIDRWAAIIAAFQRFPEGACVIDCGTACTFDLVDAHGRHRGGYILPGLRGMSDAVLGDTAIDGLGMPQPPDLAATDTGTAITHGASKALAALAERLLHDLRVATAGQPALVLTGGDAEQLGSHIALSCHIMPDLVLQGLLALLTERN